MEEYSSIAMERSSKILRRSIFAFLKNYQYFTTIAAVLALPFAASSLLAQAFVPSSPLVLLIQARLRSLFHAAGFPSSSEFVTILNLKLSETIATYLLILPFTFSFLLFAKASIIQALSNPKLASKAGFASIISVYEPLFITQICNIFLLLSANGTCFSILFFAFNSVDALGLSSPKSTLLLSVAGAVLYSMILAYAFVISNLALALSGMEKCRGYIAILQACVLIKGRAATALSVILSANIALAAAEALFQYRIVRAYSHGEMPIFFVALEGIFISYVYAILQVLNTIVGCLFYKSCKTDNQVDQEGRYCYRIEGDDKDDYKLVNFKLLEDLPQICFLYEQHDSFLILHLKEEFRKIKVATGISSPADEMMINRSFDTDSVLQ